MQTTLLDPQVETAASAEGGRMALALRAAQAFTIETDDDYALAATNATTLAGIGKAAEERRLSITRPMDEAKRKVMELFAHIVDPCTQAVTLYKRAMIAYQNKKQREREAAERAAADAARVLEQQQRDAAAKLQREADERAARDRAEADKRAETERAAAAAQMTVAAAAGDTAAAREAAAKLDVIDEAHAETVRAVDEQRQDDVSFAHQLAASRVTPIAVSAPPPPKVKGVAAPKRWKGRVVDRVEFIKAAADRARAGDLTLCAFLDVDETALNKYAGATAGMAEIPGLEFYEDMNISLRSKRP
jgi:hypothetical protein